MPRALIQSGYYAAHQTEPWSLWLCDRPNGLMHASVTGLAVVFYSILLRTTLFISSPQVHNIFLSRPLTDMDGAHVK